MYGVRLIGTDRWIHRIPGHYQVIDRAGSTWTKQPDIQPMWCQGVRAHVASIEHCDDATGAKLFFATPEKYLEIVKVAFKAIP